MEKRNSPGTKIKKLLNKSMNDFQFVETYNSLTTHELDLLIDCPNKQCKAIQGEECKKLEKGIVHIGRRIRRLLELPQKLVPGLRKKP